MDYVLIPLATVAAIAVMCLNVKAGLVVSEKTEGTGFDVGFYFITVAGLTASEISAAIFIYQEMLA